MSKIKLLIFDLDGTIIDSAPDIITAVNNLLIEMDRQPIHPDIIREAIGEGFRKLIWELFPIEGKEQAFIDHLESRLMYYYEKHLLDTTRPYPGAMEFLKTTHYKIALVTNKPIRMTELTLKGTGLDQMKWVRILGGDSLAKKKPDPLPLIETMKTAGVTVDETIMIGDGIPDILAAGAAKIPSIGCTYGYTKTERLKELGAAMLISGFHELPDALKRF